MSEITFKGKLPFAPTPAHANFSQTISDGLIK